jgi:hypothetical protein
MKPKSKFTIDEIFMYSHEALGHFSIENSLAESVTYVIEKHNLSLRVFGILYAVCLEKLKNE